MWAGDHYWFYEPLSKKHKAEMPFIDHLPKDKVGAYVPMLFPNLGLAVRIYMEYFSCDTCST